MPNLLFRTGFVDDQTIRRMNAMLAGVLLWLGASVFDCTSADYEKTCTTEDFYQQPRGLCGPKLSNILALVCSQTGYNGYNKRAHGKSS